MSSSHPKAGANPYGRFIPREELQGFASWKPGAFGGAAPAGAAAAEAPEQQALLHAARQVGYQEGYRDGLAALENFKRSLLQQRAELRGILLQQAALEVLQRRQTVAVAFLVADLSRRMQQGLLFRRFCRSGTGGSGAAKGTGLPAGKPLQLFARNEAAVRVGTRLGIRRTHRPHRSPSRSGLRRPDGARS